MPSRTTILVGFPMPEQVRAARDHAVLVISGEIRFIKFTRCNKFICDVEPVLRVAHAPCLVFLSQNVSLGRDALKEVRRRLRLKSNAPVTVERVTSFDAVQKLLSNRYSASTGAQPFGHWPAVLGGRQLVVVCESGTGELARACLEGLGLLKHAQLFSVDTTDHCDVEGVILDVAKSGGYLVFGQGNSLRRLNSASSRRQNISIWQDRDVLRALGRFYNAALSGVGGLSAAGGGNGNAVA